MRTEETGRLLRESRPVFDLSHVPLAHFFGDFLRAGEESYPPEAVPEDKKGNQNKIQTAGGQRPPLQNRGK